MQHKRYARSASSVRNDAQLMDLTERHQRLGCDDIIVAKARSDTHRVTSLGDTTIFAIVDLYTGVIIAYPCSSRRSDLKYKYLKFFVGPTWKKKPDIVVKSDADRSILRAVADLGWHPEPSLENTWPHNTTTEAHVKILKSTARGSTLQGGGDVDSWSYCVEHAGVTLAVSRPCPIQPHLLCDPPRARN